MRLLTPIIILSLAGCSSVSGAEQSFAQCRLDSYSTTGMTFQRLYPADKTAPPTKREDAAYSNFLLNCMEAKGYKYADIWNDDGKINNFCWAREENGPPYSTPWIGKGECFRRYF